MTVRKIDSGIVAIILVVLTVLVQLPAAKWVFMPHLERLIVSTMRSEMRSADNRSFLQCLIAHSEARQQYVTTIEMLHIFRGVPESERTQFHKTQIQRLEERRQLLLVRLQASDNGACSD